MKISLNGRFSSLTNVRWAEELTELQAGKDQPLMLSERDA